MFQKIIFKPFFGSKICLHPWCFCWPPQWSCHFELGQVHLAPWSHSNGRHWQSSPPLRSSQMGYQIKESVIGTIFFLPFFFLHLWVCLTKSNRINGIWWYDWYHVINKAPIWVSLTAWSRDQSNPYDLPCGEFFCSKIALQQVSCVPDPQHPHSDVSWAVSLCLWSSLRFLLFLLIFLKQQ